MSMNELGIIRARNVNGALSKLRAMMREPRRGYFWRDISPRGMQTMEYRGPMVTEYQQPMERVLWSRYRDANPFFHLMESLWILAGRQDVKFLTQFNAKMAEYSDDGEVFHAPYGHRLRHWEDYQSDDGKGLDQIAKAIELLSKDHATRQVVLSIWNPSDDLGAVTKDMPCNDLIMFKVRDGVLNMTVACRSNDAIWGAYGANAVQFSMLQEFIAAAVGVEVGVYRQVSDSFHVYTDQSTWLNVMNGKEFTADPYLDMGIEPFPLLSGIRSDSWPRWLVECEAFCNREWDKLTIPFFKHVAAPMNDAWFIYKNSIGSKEKRAKDAIKLLDGAMAECDWQLAGSQWLMRHGGLTP